MKRGIIMNSVDNVATLLDDIASGETATIRGLAQPLDVAALDAIPRGHKIAVTGIRSGADIVKYGFPVGYALADIAKGSYVHVHNVGSKRTEE